MLKKRYPIKINFSYNNLRYLLLCILCLSTKLAIVVIRHNTLTIENKTRLDSTEVNIFALKVSIAHTKVHWQLTKPFMSNFHEFISRTYTASYTVRHFFLWKCSLPVTLPRLQEAVLYFCFVFAQLHALVQKLNYCLLRVLNNSSCNQKTSIASRLKIKLCLH